CVVCSCCFLSSYCFFFQAEDGIRDDLVTGVQTCALPILQMAAAKLWGPDQYERLDALTVSMAHPDAMQAMLSGRSEITGHFAVRSEERRVGKECRCGWAAEREETRERREELAEDNVAREE